jgi:predicted outer membrane protein
MWKACSLLAVALIATQVFAQQQQGNQNPPTAPRVQSPAQDQGAAQGQGTIQAQGQGQGVGQPGAQLQQGNRQIPGQRTANYRGDSAVNASRAIDSHLAACLILGNEEEVALGRFAAQRASNDQVKQFAQQMVDQHSKAISKLQPFAPEGAMLELAAASEQDQGPRQNQGQRQGQIQNPLTPVGQNGQADANIGQQMLAIERDAKQQCLDLTQKVLGEKRGEEFDHAYVGQQMAGHIQMIAALTAFERHASPELQQVLNEQKQTAEQHLQHLKQLIPDSTSASKTSSNR